MWSSGMNVTAPRPGITGIANRPFALNATFVCENPASERCVLLDMRIAVVDVALHAAGERLTGAFVDGLAANPDPFSQREVVRDGVLTQLGRDALSGWQVGRVVRRENREAFLIADRQALKAVVALFVSGRPDPFLAAAEERPACPALTTTFTIGAPLSASVIRPTTGIDGAATWVNSAG